MSTERQESKLIRNIGFWPLMGIAYGQIIGAGIMTQTGIAIGMTGTGVVLAYIVSAICTTFQNFPTAILGATVPVSGGEYRYISRLRGKKWGFVYLATYVVSKLTIALYALSCASYLVAFLTGISENIIAVCLLIAAFAINLLGTKQSAFVTTGITALLLPGMALFLFYGLPETDIAYVFDPSNLMANGPGSLLSAIALLSFTTGGAQVIGNMGSEIIEPQKNMPHARTHSGNEKYTFRTWLLRLGLIGDEFKTARGHLLKNLEGNIAWKDPAQAQAQKERLARKRLEETAQLIQESAPEPEQLEEDVQPSISLSM